MARVPCCIKIYKTFIYEESNYIDYNHCSYFAMQ